MTVLNKFDIARFEAKFTKLGRTDCWEWAGTVTKVEGSNGGYGRAIIAGRRMRAHRVSY